MNVPCLEPMLPGPRIIPVLTLHEPAMAVPLARALVAGGLRVLEVTLRTPSALACAEAIATKVPEAIVGFGTLVRSEQFVQARDAGARFLVSPALTDRLAEAAKATGLPYLPAIATVSEALAAWEHGFRELKFFPAMLNGGAPALKGMAPLLPDVRFCPTGGLTAANVHEILSLPNVFAMGGTWLTPADAIKDRRWDDVERLTREAVARMPAP